MKVLLTHHYFPPDFAGGGEVVVFETARGLMRRGIDVTVLTTGDPAITAYEDVPTIRLPIHRYAFNLAYATILKHARHADLIQTFNYHACLPSLAAGKRLRKPVVCSILALNRRAWNQLRSPVTAPLWASWERYVLTRDFSRVVFPSQFSLQQGTDLGVAPARAVVNNPGIAIEAYAPAPQKDDVVFFTGRLDKRRGIDTVLATARALPHVRFRVMGWGPHDAQVRGAAPPNLEVVPFERGETHRREFARARIFFLPSRAETFGMALVEAMASGCAVVSSVPLEFEGIGVDADDTGAMVRAIQTLWDDPVETARMGRANRALAQHYSWDRFTNSMLLTYEQVLNGT